MKINVIGNLYNPSNKKINFKGTSSEPWLNNAPKPMLDMTINTLNHFKKSDYIPRTIKLIPLSELQKHAKYAKAKADFVSLSLNASLRAKNLFIEGVEKNNKSKIKESSEYFAFSLRMQTALDKNGFNDEQTENIKLSKALDLTRAYVVLDEPDNAVLILDHFYKNADKKVKKKYKASVALLEKQIGVCYFNKKDTNKAISRFKKSIELFKNINNQESLLNSQMYLSRSYLSIKDYNKAIESFNEVIDGYSKTGNSKGVEVAKSYIAKAYSKKGDYKKAIELNKEVLKHSNEFINSKFITLTKDHLGQCYLHDNQIDKAIKYFEESLKVKGIKTISRAHTHTNLGNAYYKKGAMGKYLKHKLYFASYYLKLPKTSLKDRNMDYFQENIEYVIPKLRNKELADKLKDLNFDDKQTLKSQVDEIIEKHFDGEV